LWPKEAQNRPGWGPFALPSPELSAEQRWNCGGAADGAGVGGLDLTGTERMGISH